MIEFCSEDVDMPVLDLAKISIWVEKVISTYNASLGELCYIFCSDVYILQVNNEYLQHDYYTDIITFDYCEAGLLSGDLFISLDTVSSNAVKFKQSFEKELLRVIIHGVLHLCGLKDKSVQDAHNMRIAEDRAIALFNRKEEF